MTIQGSLANNAFWSLISHLLSRGTLMLVAIILARALPTTDFAAYSYFQLTVAMIGAYAALGLGTTASRYFAEVGYETNDQPSKPLGALCSISIIISIAAGLMVLTIPESWISADLAMPPWLLAAGVVATALGVVPGGAILGLEQYRAAAVISFLYGALLIVAAFMAARYQAPTFAMGSLVLGAFLQAAGQFGVVIRTIGWRRVMERFIFDRNDAQKILLMAGPLFLITLMSASGSWLVGRIILHGADGSYSFALYSIGLQWYSLALLLPGMVSRVVLPRLVRASGNTIGKSVAIVRSGILLASTTGIFVSFIAIAFGPFFGTMYGKNYNLDRFFIAAYMAAALLSAPTNTLGNAILARDGQLTWLKNTIVWFAAILGSALFAESNGMGLWTGSFAHAAAGGTLLVLAYTSCRRRRLI